jgi:hypothetical protein
MTITVYTLNSMTSLETDGHTHSKPDLLLSSVYVFFGPVWVYVVTHILLQMYLFMELWNVHRIFALVGHQPKILHYKQILS